MTPNSETYVSACRRLGLTALSAERIRELYAAGDGMRIDIIDADAATLAAAAAMAEDALASARSAADALTQAWAGRTGWAATDFLDRQCCSAAVLVAGLRDAAYTLRALRARLTDLVEAKADTAEQIDDRRRAERGRWLAASAAVLGGAADQAAIDIVRGEISPYVDADIAGQWVPAMVRCNEAVEAAYRDAVSAITERSPVRFEIPTIPSGSLPVSGVRSRASSPPVPVAPVTAPAIPPAAPSAIPAVSDVGLPGGFGGAWSPGFSEPFSDRPRRTAKRTGLAERDDSEEDDADEVKDDTPSIEPELPPPGAPAPLPPAVVPEPTALESEPVAVEDIPPTTPAPLAAEAPDPPAPDERTPCEIAADELPQVGG